MSTPGNDSHQTAPPLLAARLLRACCSRRRLEEIEGDLLELYLRRHARSGPSHARRRYVRADKALLATSKPDRNLRADPTRPNSPG